MPRSSLARALRGGSALALIAVACGGAEQTVADTAAARSEPAAVSAVDTATPESRAPFAFTAADVEAYERGISREADLVRAARERGRAATTPAERGAAAQGEWEDATIPGGARAAGLELARYRKVRETVHHVLETLDLQGTIDGPQELDPSQASAETRRRLAGDAFAELAPASAAALRARLDRVARAYVGYMTLTAVNG